MNDRLQLGGIDISAFRRLGRPCHFDFAPGPGITILVGPNGSGKSTVLDAIEWTLTNSASRLPELAGPQSRAPDVYRTLGSTADPKVTLTFREEDGSEQILSSGGSEQRIAAVLRRSDDPWSDIRSIAAALRWTHFSSQRSTARLGYENGDAILKAFAGPAGLERLKGLDQRLWGRDTQSAIRELEREIDERTARHETALQRLEHAAPPTSEEVTFAFSRRLVDLFASLQQEPGLPVDDHVTDLSLVESQLTAVRSRIVAKIGDLRSLRSASRDGSLRRTRLEVERDEASQSLATAEQVANRRREARDLAQADRAARQEELERLNAMRVEAARALSSQAERARQDVERASIQRRLAELRTRDESAGATLVQITELEGLTRWLRAVTSLREVDAELAILADFGDPDAIQEAASREIATLTARQRELSNRREESQAILVRETERLKSLNALANALAAHLHHDDTACPVCAASYPPGELAARARAAAVTLGPAAEQVTRSLSETTQELGHVSGQLRVAESRLEEARGVASSLARRRAEREELTMLLDSEALPMDAVGDVESKILDLRLLFAVDDEPGIRSLRDLVKRRRQDLATRMSEAEVQLARVEEILAILARQSSGDRSEAELRADLRAIDVQIDRLNVQLNAATNEHGLAVQLAEGAEDNVKRLRELQRNASEALSDEDARVAKSLDALTAILGERSELEFVQELEEQAARIGQALERVASLRDEMAAAASAGNADELALLRNTYLPKEGDPGISELRAAVEERLQQAIAESAALKSLKTRLSRRARERRDIDQRLQGTALRPWNSLFKAVYASLAGSLGETLEWTADRVDMRLRDIESHVRPHVAGEPIPGWLAGHWFSEGQLAALQISAMITASVLLPWSRWRALLLDDPLQHADVIKVGAFADLIRALCSDKQHQVIMTTHDRVQADFIAAKFLAGGLAAKIIPFERNLPTQYDQR